MKNAYQIFGDITVIFIDHKGGMLTTLISTEDLEVVSSIAGRWYAMDVGKVKGDKIYVGTNIGGITVYLHQVIAMNPPKTVVDHINHNTLDNRRENLRIVSIAKNCQNRKSAQRNNRTSGYRNVYRNRHGNWYVRLQCNGKTIHVGTFKDIEAANQAAILARQKYFGIA